MSDSKAIAMALRRLADAMDAGDVKVDSFDVKNDVDIIDEHDDFAGTSVKDVVFRGQWITFKALSARNVMVNP